MMWIIAILIIILTLSILKDTHVEKYYRYCGPAKLQEEMEALEYYDVKHPKIVQAQAILETGNFTSEGCLVDNNLFGLYDSKRQRYYSFDHWTESVVAYLDYIQCRYKPPNDYYKFLQDIGYAKDPHYINKVKEIVKQNDKRRSE